MKQNFYKGLLLAVVSFIFYKSGVAFQKIAWGTGDLWGEYSMKWGGAYLFYIAGCFSLEILCGFILFRPEKFKKFFDVLISAREKLAIGRWLIALLLLAFPVWFFQYTSLGIIFSDVYIRVLIWCSVTLAISFLITSESTILGWMETFIVVLVTSAEFVIFESFKMVTGYPFSLGWSEGNRLWDYSIIFGRYLYDYPANTKIPVFLDTGRQIIGGLPFLIHGLTIGTERFWIGLTAILPYLLLGFAAFRSARREWTIYILTVLWTLLFLKQGPIHPPLVLCAAIVALAWRSPLWIAIPMIVMSGVAAEQSRYTWLFAPGMWIGMLELAGAELQNGKLSRSAWVRALSLGLAGIAGGFFAPKVVSMASAWFAGQTANGSPSTAVTVTGVSNAVGRQPLLWYRLLPNATYGDGILFGLLIATLPLIIVLIHLAVSKQWRLNIWQGLAILAPLLAFLVVGLIASTKIGGGGDLHNMDMFLIGLLFTAVLAWQRGGREWLLGADLVPIALRLILFVMISLPALQSLQDMRSYNYAKDASRLMNLTDTPSEDALDMYPSKEIVGAALATIQQEVSLARAQGGEILFMDQRQLLTFGFIKNVPLIPQYDKKLLMDQALSSNAGYFRDYYADLAARRFALIISEPLRKPVKDESYEFGEENNAWVKWVSIPTLCYYEPKVMLKEVGVQLLVPRTDTANCSSLLPEGAQP